ncbi:2-phosphosulfolactate phosphatase [bacterium]|nr:2-phosphosulfolactate phosphatase [bacterium]
MHLDIYTSPKMFTDALAKGSHVVAIDVLRASSTIVEACENGVQRIIPVDAVENATRLLPTLERAETLLGGEQEGRAIEGFDLGNSPTEYTRAVVAGKTLVFCTTNGTVAITKSAAAENIVIGCFLNLNAVVSHITSSGPDRVAILCAGNLGVLSLEDFACGGHLVERLHAAVKERITLSDGATAARALAATMPDPAEIVRASTHGRLLSELGFDDDLEFCSRMDTHASVPMVVDGRIAGHDTASR